MTTLSIRLPESLHKQVRELASQEGISINQFAATAIAEKLSALMTSNYLERRAAQGERAKFEQALAKVCDALPEAHDRL
jgi:predicted transcriptional regulator